MVVSICTIAICHLLPFLCFALTFTKEWLEEQLHAYKAGVECVHRRDGLQDLQANGIDTLW